MAKKVYTIDVDNKDLTVSAGSKKTNSVKAEKKNEVEDFGVVEINNSSSKCKIKNASQKGYEKNVVTSTKKSVKANLSKVDDYFDFSFKKESSAKTEKAETKVETKVEVKAEAKVETKKETKKDVAPKATSTLKMESKTIETKVTDSVKFDSEAYQIVRVARMGSLFDCEKCMINA